MDWIMAYHETSSTDNVINFYMRTDLLRRYGFFLGSAFFLRNSNKKIVISLALDMKRQHANGIIICLSTHCICKMIRCNDPFIAARN